MLISPRRSAALCAVPAAQVITRPNTGTLAYELDLYELKEKYERVPDEEQAISTCQQAWTLVGVEAFDPHLFFLIKFTQKYVRRMSY